MAPPRSVPETPPDTPRAIAERKRILSSATPRVVRAGFVARGDPLSADERAGLRTMKPATELSPDDRCCALAGSRVEREAFVGATVSPRTVWDTVKYPEKVGRGLYPRTALGPVRVRSKEKGWENQR